MKKQILCINREFLFYCQMRKESVNQKKTKKKKKKVYLIIKLFLKKSILFFVLFARYINMKLFAFSWDSFYCLARIH